MEQIHKDNLFKMAFGNPIVNRHSLDPEKYIKNRDAWIEQYRAPEAN